MLYNGKITLFEFTLLEGPTSQKKSYDIKLLSFFAKYLGFFILLEFRLADRHAAVLASICHLDFLIEKKTQNSFVNVARIV